MWPLVSTINKAAESPGPDWLAVESPAMLLAPFKAVTDGIRLAVGVPDRHWRDLYLPLLHNYAALCQHLPASEVHHHAEPLGLLRHGLETLFEAVLARRKYLLPPGAPAEQIAAQEDLWTYAAATSALLHDVGKSIADLLVTYVAATDGRPQVWQPLTAVLPSGAFYRYRFRPGRQYRRHELLPPLLAHRLLPAAGLAWLASESAVFDAWLATISHAENAGPLAAIAQESDGKSVARDLSGGVRTRSPAARTRPLAERLLTGLRHLVREGVITLNRPGASGFIADGSLWLVSKRVLDDLREHLTREGQTGIPGRNDRLMDELQQWQVLHANGGQAVWYCDIRVGGWLQRLTCLRVDLALVWPDPAQVPPVDDVSVTPAPDGPASKVSPGPVADDASPSGLYRTPPAAAGETATNPVETAPVTALPTAPSEATSVRTPTAKEQPAPAAMPTAPPLATEEPTPADDETVDIGQRFVNWLRQNLREGRVAINTPRARVHVLAEGLALITPGIFRDFSPEHWDRAQKRFQKLKIHAKTGSDTNIWTCQVVKERRASTVKVMLIPDAATVLGIALPEPNPVMTLINAEQPNRQVVSPGLPNMDQSGI